ncbi:cystinosin [Entomortierella parvispora]|uniref:Cystinosin n=1 Tax=Entomortierella parvispora TaxID=205924 RepID=A0A9P3M0Y3_9FUNG|nr:cystinosin [Entomortierella parvispora]
MPSSDVSMQSISAPILVPGTQQAPTTPPHPSDRPQHHKSTASSASTTGSTEDPIAFSDKNLPPMTALTRTATRPLNGSASLSAAPHSPKSSSNHHYNNHKDTSGSSGLGRFPSLGNKKLSKDNATFRAKIVELERYLTGLKEELILANRQIHGQRLEIKNLIENHEKNMEDLKQVVQTCEFEMGVKVLECQDWKTRLGEKEKEVEEKAKRIEELVQEIQASRAVSTELVVQAAVVSVGAGKGNVVSAGDNNNNNKEDESRPRRAHSPVNRVVDFMRQSEDDDRKETRVQALEEANAQKEAQILELMQKIDRLGSEVSSLERERAQWQRNNMPAGSASPSATSARATTSRGTVPSSLSDSSIRTGSSLVPPSPSQQQQQQGVVLNSVGYDLSAEHQKLLVKFRALSMQHAQASDTTTTSSMDAVASATQTGLGPWISHLIGWAYFFAWSASFYPQAIYNYRRKSVQGLSLDFLALNVVGFLFYSVFNLAFFFSEQVQEEYRQRNDGQDNLVRANDVIFAVHALVLSSVTLFQSFIYKRDQDQKVAGPTKVLILISLIGAGLVSASVVAGTSQWIDLLYYLSYIKLGISFLKYCPQLYLNFTAKSTVGWSIHNILLDFTGGVLSIGQLVLDSSLSGDWSGISGDPVKFGLGFLSIAFDLIFMTQHFVLYRNREDFYAPLSMVEANNNDNNSSSPNGLASILIKGKHNKDERKSLLAANQKNRYQSISQSEHSRPASMKDLELGQ